MGKTKKLIKEEYKNIIPVVQINPEYGSNTARFKVIGSMDKDNKISDDIIPVESQIKNNRCGKNDIYICEADGYIAKSTIYKCNIPATYILNATKIPMFYMKVIYERQFLSGALFNIFLYYTINKKTLDSIIDPTKYLLKTLEGTYTFELIADDDFISELTKYVKPQYEKQCIEEILNGKSFDELSEAEMDKIIPEIHQSVESKIQKFIELLKPVKLEIYPHKSKIIQYMQELCKNDTFIEMITQCIKMRDSERRTTGSELFNCTIPKRIFNLKELKENPDKIDELLQNETLNRSSDETDYSEEE